VSPFIPTVVFVKRLRCRSKIVGGGLINVFCFRWQSAKVNVTAMIDPRRSAKQKIEIVDRNRCHSALRARPGDPSDS
jgi:hypothetical protein